MNLRKAFPSLAIAVVALLALAGCGSIANSYGNTSKHKSTSGGAAAAMPAASSPAAAAAPATGHSVAIQNFTFAPQTLTVKAGTKVTWTNNDSTGHTVTADDGSFTSDRLGSGTTFSQIFAKAGTFAYHCSIQSSMKGTVTVK